MPTVKSVTAKRIRAVEKALPLVGENGFGRLFRRAEESDFLTGRSGKWKGCGFDWILEPENLNKILAGNYDNARESPGFHDLFEDIFSKPSYDIEELERID